LQQQRVWQEAKTLMLFAPLPEELDVWPLLGAALAAGKQVALPRYAGTSAEYIACWVREPEKDLEVGHYGIREPNETCTIVPLLRLDFILVPGVAFDLHGRRLGRGKGHYDRVLAAARGTTCGVAFDEQIVREVPVEPHDVHLNCILTPTRWIEL
jgi:5-formyltetrahydrofolate cyclo-ligase